MSANDLIPVSVLTGFLGSGKTTMLRYLLAQPELSRTAVIINEFGEIGLDHDLIETSEDSLIELRTGCLCCKVRSDLSETLYDLLRRRDEGRCSPFNRVVIETSGLADPAPILQTLMTDTEIADRIVLSGVITTLDAVNGQSTLDHEEISRKQLAVADRIVVTKVDLANPDLTKQVRRLNPHAPVLTADNGRIDPSLLLNAGLYDPDTKSADVAAWLSHDGAGHRHDHAKDIQTYAIVRTEPIPAVALTLFIEALAEHCGSSLLRLKGIVNVRENSEKPAVIHGVQHVFHPPAWLEQWPSADRRSQIVVITRRVPQRWVELLLEVICQEVSELPAR